MIGRAEMDVILRQLRIVAILDAATDAGMTPIPVFPLHTVIYLADALSPVWGVPILDRQILKATNRPFFPRFQADIDRMVGQGVVKAVDVHFERDESGAWRKLAAFENNDELARPIIECAESLAGPSRELDFVREVVYAVSGLGIDGIAQLGHADAAYADPDLDVGAVLEIQSDAGVPNAAAQVALRFNQIGGGARFSSAEMVHLYVRHLYRRINVA